MVNPFRIFCTLTISFFLILISSIPAIAQKTINAVWVGPHGVTKKLDSAKYIILVRYVSDSNYQRVEYNMTGPMIRLVSFKDPAMTIRQGPYYEYREDGWIKQAGKYENNQKEGTWMDFGDSAKVTMKSEYSADHLLSSEPEEHHPTGRVPAPGEKEAVFPGGMTAYKKFLLKHFKIPDRADMIGKEGTLFVFFFIDTDGSPKSSFISKSIELSLDDEAMRLINSMPSWNPAMKDGKAVKSYFQQPFSLSFQ